MSSGINARFCVYCAHYMGIEIPKWGRPGTVGMGLEVNTGKDE